MSISQENHKAFTFKSLLGGILGALFISSFAGFNDNVLEQTLLVGNHFPVGGYFYFFCLAFVWNFFLGGMFPKIAFNPKELVVCLGMTLVACWVPTSGLFRYFHRQLILPWFYENNMPVWQKTGVLDYLPKKIFPNEAEVDDSVYLGFVQGVAKGNETVPFVDLPLAEWLPALAYWGPLFIFFAVATIALSLVINRQWAHHEQLSYPLAFVANSLIKRTGEKPYADIFRNKLFWLGVLPVLGIYMINYLSVWFGSYIPRIPMDWSILGFYNHFPSLLQAGAGGIGITNGSFYFIVIGATYFISSSIGLSMGLSQILLAGLFVQFYLITGERVSAENMEIARGGAYFGYAAILLYTGWSFYSRIMISALTFRKDRNPEAVFAARLLIVSFLGMTGMLVSMGLDWLIATLFCLTMLTLFIVLTRVVCESGIPFIQASWFPGTLLTHLFGATAIGAAPLVFISYLNTIFTQDPRECLAPYVATSLKVADENKIPLMKYAFVLMGAVILAMVVGFGVTFYNLYNFGGINSDIWASVHVPKGALNKAANELNFLAESGSLQKSIDAVGLGKLGMMQFDSEVWGWFLSIMTLVVLLSVLRFRLPNLPIHPILFLVWGTFPIMKTWFCFLVGWAIKELIVRFGGGKSYNTLKPLFIGLIMGELIAVAITIIVGAVYYSITGVTTPYFQILPN